VVRTSRRYSAEPRPDHPYAAEIEAERSGWCELVALVRSLTPDECLVPGYYVDPDWTVRDLTAHLRTRLAEAEIQLERLTAGTYAGHDLDIDALNAAFLEAMRDRPWKVAWTQANAGRTRMVQEWYASASRPTRPRGGCGSPGRTTTSSTLAAFASGSTR
jgi:hypothetical protein